MITTRDVARAAGVAQSTVSRALRNHPQVSVKTRLRLQELAVSMGYKPNPLVAAFMSAQRSAKAPSQRHVMAYLTTDLQRGAWSAIHTYVDFFEGARERAASYGFDLQEFWLKEPRMTGHRMSQILFHRNIGGVLIAPLRSDSYGKTSGMGHISLDWQRFAVATLGYTMMRPRVHRAVHNNLLGIRLALRQIKKLGYRRPGLVLHSAHDARVDNTWTTAFSHYLLTQRPSNRIAPFLRPTAQYNFEEFMRWFEQERPDVILAGSSTVYTWMQQAGIRTPRDCGFAVLDLFRKEHLPSVAGINQNSKAVAAAAVDLVVGQLHRNEHGLPDLPKTTLIDGFWTNGTTVRQV